MANKKLKKLPATSLYIVEDHNDVRFSTEKNPFTL
jgi:hypothetical protein